jgi:hypothetical protein
MQNIIDFRGLEALKTSSEMSTELSRLAQKNAEKSQKDARTITTITIFTMIYLPASFVSVSSQISWHALSSFKTTDRVRVFKAIFKYGIR